MFVAGQPQLAVAVHGRVALHDVGALDDRRRDLLEVADEAHARQVGRRPRLAVRQLRVRVPPRQRERDVRACDGVARRRADRQGEERRVPRLRVRLAGCEVVGEGYRGRGKVGGREAREVGGGFGEDGRENAGGREGEESPCEDR